MTDELQPADEAFFGALERLHAACRSDADLQRLPALRGFIETELATISEALKYIIPAGEHSIVGFSPTHRFAPPTWQPVPEENDG